MKSSSSSSPLPGRLNIAASAKKLDVDHRISLRYYYRMADSILRQADIFRSEDNAIDLYVMLLRYSSLVSETIPYHRDYRASSQSKKVILKKKLLGTLTELEKLKPEEHQRLDDIKRKESIQIHRNNVLEWPITKKQSVANYDRQLVVRTVVRESIYQNSRIQPSLPGRPLEEQFHRMRIFRSYCL